LETYKHGIHRMTRTIFESSLQPNYSKNHIGNMRLISLDSKKWCYLLSITMSLLVSTRSNYIMILRSRTNCSW